MNARILAPEEWSRLDGIDLSKLLPYTEPQNIAVCVVEDEAGKIVACLAALQVTLLEGTWIAPEHRKKAGTLRALLRQAFAVPRVRQERWAYGTAETGNEEIHMYLSRLGGVQMPVTLFALPVGGN